MKEIELRCDAVAIVTMSRLGLDRGALLSGVAKLTRFNERRGVPNRRDLCRRPGTSVGASGEPSPS